MTCSSMACCCYDPNLASGGFVGNDDPALGEQLFHIPKAQAELIIMPAGVANDFG